MTNFTTLSNSHTCTQNVEFSLPNNANFSSGSPRTTTGYVGVRIDLTTLVAGDLCEVRIYSGVNGGTLTSQDVATVDVAQIYLIWPMLVTNGWDFSVKITTATSRVVQWDVIQDTNDVNMNSVTAGAIAAAAFASGAITSTVIAASAIGASQIASAAITAAKFATDALDANALAASAVTEIQTGLATSGSITTLQTSATDIQARLPAALVGGKISSDVGSWLGTAAAAPTVAGIPKVEVSSMGAGTVTAGAIASAAITAAKFATDALDANALAASAVTEIQTGLATSGSITTLQTSATDIQARLPAALVGGKISSDVGSWLGTAAAAPTVAGIPKVEEAALRISVVDIQSRLPTALDGSGNIKCRGQP